MLNNGGPCIGPCSTPAIEYYLFYCTGSDLRGKLKKISS